MHRLPPCKGFAPAKMMRPKTGDDLMVILDAHKIHKGTYRYCRRNNPSAQVYLYDLDRLIYKLGADFALSVAGALHPKAQLGHAAVSFHPSEARVAVILEDQSLALCNFEGAALHHYAGAYACVFYARGGEYIWAAEKLDKKRLRISVFSGAGLLLEQCEMKDELYDSHLILSDIPYSDKVILELAAGQDGVSLYECQYGAAISIKEFALAKEFPKSSFVTPAWSPDGSRLITLENDMQTYASFTYPKFEQIAVSENDFEDEDEAPGYNLIYLQNGLAIVQNANYRHFLFDPVKMERLAELVFAAYEPVPAHQIYKNLKDDDTLCARIVYFDRIGGELLAARTDERHDEAVLLLINEKDICLP